MIEPPIRLYIKHYKNGLRLPNTMFIDWLLLTHSNNKEHNTTKNAKLKGIEKGIKGLWILKKRNKFQFIKNNPYT